MAERYDDVIQRLRSLGLSLYEAKAYIAILKKKVTTSTEISKEAKIPQPRIYDVIKSLESKGLVIVSEGRPKLLRAVEPSEGLKRLVDRIIDRINESQRMLVSTLNSLYSSSEREYPHGIWRVDGENNVFGEINRVMSTATHELLLSLYRSMVKKVQPKLEKLYRKGVSICVVLYDSGEVINHVDEQYYKKTRGNVIVIADRKEMLFSAPAFEGEEAQLVAGHVTENQSLVKMFAEYFIHNLTDLADPVYIAYGDSVFDRSFVHIPRAIRMISFLRAKGFTPVVNVKGRLIRDRVEIEIMGIPVENVYDVKEGIGRIVLKADDKWYAVGGWGAYLEDIEAEIIRVFAEKKS